ncbi:MAG: MFS transporter [Acidilobus sp.]
MRVEDRVAAISAIRVLGFSLTMPFVGFALNELYRVPLPQVSVYYMALAVSGALGQIAGGAASDRLGRAKVMALSVALAGLFLGTAAALSSPAYIEAFTALQSLASGSFASSSSALVGDYFTEHARLVRAYGRVRVGSNLGWAVGVAVGGALYQLLGLRTLFAFTALTQASTLPLITGLPSQPARGPTRVERPPRPLAVFLIPTFLTFIIAGLMGYPLVQYLSGVIGLSTGLAGSLLAFNGALVVLLQDRLSGLASRLRPSAALSLGMVIYAAGYGALPALRSYAQAVLDVALITLGEMIVMPVSSAVAARTSSPTSRGTHMGVYGLAGSVARTMSSSIFAALLSAAPAGDAWAAESLVALAAAAGYLALTPRSLSA